MSRTLMFFVVLLVLVAPASAVQPATDDAANGRPRVALVLSGGGARGAAHVGVIRVLEEMRIPVDLVVGTSMGAVVGGLYASGLDADALEQVIRDIDWVDAFDDNPPRKDLTYRRKRDDDEFLVGFDLGVRDGEVRFPKGIIQAQKLNLYLRELSLPVAQVDDFDQLPTRFRAVAADLGSGDTVVLERGDLALAMRASMSAPGVFAPAQYNGRTLVDGGIAMNLPVAVARDLGADVIIAVDVGFPLLEANALTSAVAVSNQMLTILIERETRHQRALLTDADLLIQPDLAELGSTEFLRAADAIETGYISASQRRTALQSLGVSKSAYARYATDRSQQRAALPIPSFVHITTDAGVSDGVVLTRMATAPGQPLSLDVLRQDLARIYGLGLFEQVDYEWADVAGERGLVVNARAKSWGPGFLRFGISLEEDFEGSSAFALSARYLQTAINELGAEWRTNFSFGTNTLFSSEFYQPLSNNLRYFVAPSINIEQRNISLFADQDRVARFRLTSGEALLSVGREISNLAEVRAGIYRGTGNASVKVGDPSLQRIDFNTGGYRVSLGYDTLDDTLFPSSGQRFEVTANFARRSLSAPRDYETYRSTYDVYRTRGRHTLSFGLDLATNNNADDIIEETNLVGGFLNLSGLDRDALAGPHAAVARVVYQRRTGRLAKGPLDTPFYIGGSVEAGNVWQRAGDAGGNDLIYNASLFLRVDTFLGPAYLASGFGENGETSFYLFIGATPN
ncbi:MAG: patatin-like phospholipase family protein [Pseudomonadota bacterium]